MPLGAWVRTSMPSDDGLAHEPEPPYAAAAAAASFSSSVVDAPCAKLV